MSYILSKKLEIFLNLAISRMVSGLGATLLLEGPPGAGKTAFAKEMAQQLNGKLFYYSGSPDKERDLLYEIDVQGVLSRQNAWVPAPAWQAFSTSQSGKAVLLIDEVDKTSQGFDAFLLRLLEDFAFRSPSGETITANPENLAVILTSNGRRELRPEVLRRCQRIAFEHPSKELLIQIINEIIFGLPSGLISLIIKISETIKNIDENQYPSPKEMALACFDVREFSKLSNDCNLVKEIACSYLTKGITVEELDKVFSYNWGNALITEGKK